VCKKSGIKYFRDLKKGIEDREGRNNKKNY